MLIIISLIGLYGCYKLINYAQKIKRKGRQDMAEDPFDGTEITEYPTYWRNKK